jgi:nucleoside-diphosphate-sugar epimerase
MRVFITGTAGYLGSLLAPELIEKGYEVIGLDTGFYKERSLYRAPGHTPFTLTKDLRRVSGEDLEGVDAVVHMAELSNDPAGQLAPHITYEINHEGSVRLARLAKLAGVKRFVYMSSCSVYGVADKGFVDEESPVSPQTSYAACKALVEADVRPLADDNFSPIFMRNATAYGASPGMRFDIVLNNLCGLAITEQEIRMTSDGTPWRPLVHGLDIAAAIIAALEAPTEAIHNETFNLGSNDQNYQVREIAEIVADIFPACSLSFGTGTDNRSYRVSFSKIHKHLPAFTCRWNAKKGAEQLYELFKRIELSRETYNFRTFTRLKQLEYLIRTKQIDDRFFWQKA